MVFHALMKRGWIDRSEDAAAWEAYLEQEVQEELNDFRAELEFDLYRSGDRLYMIPTQDNDLFLKNNVDYRRDIKAENDVRTRDLYLLNYLAIYLIYLFFHGDGRDPRSREYITKEAFLSLFSEHCKSVTEKAVQTDEIQTDYSENFLQLAENWLSKLEGEPGDRKITTRYGCMNKILGKLKTDELFDVNDLAEIRPTRKLNDLMPYFLRKDRITEIHAWAAGKDET